MPCCFRSTRRASPATPVGAPASSPRFGAAAWRRSSMLRSRPRRSMALSRTARHLGLGALLWLAALAGPAQAAHVVLFAAASTTEPLSEIIHRYEAEGRGDVAVSFGSSSTLAKQIENGAPADIFLSADEAWMDYLAKRDLVSRETRTDYLHNTLVLIAPQDSELAVTIAPGFPLAASLHNGRLAMGDPDHVPAGIYGKAALEKLGVWKS